MNRHRPFRPLRLLMTLVVAGVCQTTFAACTVTTPPVAWPAGSARWDGECAGDKANGLGVLKEQQGTAVKALFFGRVEGGELALGVIDVPENGFVAGRFQQGAVVPDAERQTLISAFETAAQAAAAAAERFEASGNKASAAYYRSKEQVLREQLD